MLFHLNYAREKGCTPSDSGTSHIFSIWVIYSDMELRRWGVWPLFWFWNQPNLSIWVIYSDIELQSRTYLAKKEHIYPPPPFTMLIPPPPPFTMLFVIINVRGWSLDHDTGRKNFISIVDGGGRGSVYFVLSIVDGWRGMFLKTRLHKWICQIAIKMVLLI